MKKRVVGSGYRNDRGMALLLVISVISVLTVVVLQFNRSMRYGMVEAARYQDREVLRTMVESGLDIACSVLHTDRLLNEYDTLLESWALLAEEPIAKPFDPGELRLFLSNLDGRFPVNRLVEVGLEGQNLGEGDGITPDQAREILIRLLSSGIFAVEDESAAREIVDSLVDWLDSDDIESPYGAESSYYESLENPYRPRNGPVKFIDELVLVKGVSAELLYGNDEKSGLKEYISVYNGEGKINLNTAPIEVFQALDDRITKEDAEVIDEFRKDEAAAEQLENASWYQNVSGWPGDIVIDSKVLTTKGTYFLLESEAAYKESEMSLAAVVKRVDDKEMQIVYQRVN